MVREIESEKEPQTKELGQQLGRIFEVGFNLGMLSYIEQNKFKHSFGTLFRQDLHKLSLPHLVQQIVTEGRITDPNNIEIIKKWVSFFLQKGWLSGLNFFHEYNTQIATVASSSLPAAASRRRSGTSVPPIIRYYQCSFSDENSLGLYNKGSGQQFKQLLANQFPALEDSDAVVSRFNLKRGEFAQADTLILLEYPKQYRILCIDLSVFFIKSIRDLKDLDDVAVQRTILLSEINYLRSKSVFSGLSIDSDALDLTFSEGLQRYITAFARGDKESYKLVQAASYAYSFYNFLQEKNLLTNPNIPHPEPYSTDSTSSATTATKSNNNSASANNSNSGPEQTAPPIISTTTNSAAGDNKSSIVNGSNIPTPEAKKPVVFNVVGYSDRGISAMSITAKNMGVLATCSKIYKHENSDLQVDEARHAVLETIKQAASRSFANVQEGRVFLNSLLALADNTSTSRQPINQRNSASNDKPETAILEISHHERISGFVNSASYVRPELLQKLGLTPTTTSADTTSHGIRGDGKHLRHQSESAEPVVAQKTLRDAHAELIRQTLSPTSPETYLFLNGNPGIGKTTAIIDYLVDHQQEGFLFFYVSPRKQVNLDVIKKFRDGNVKGFRTSKFLGLNTNADVIRDNGGNYTVKYVSNTRKGNFVERSVQFIETEEEMEEIRNPASPTKRNNSKNRPVFTRRTEEEIGEAGGVNRGVLASISEAVFAAIDCNLATNIAATVSIQSLKKVSKGGNHTLQHFKKIFRNGLNGDKPITAEMQKISGKLRNLFIMIDEITGDDTGVEFLTEISKILKDLGLFDPANGFNTKLIVADASIVDANVISQHLSNRSPEPDKIFFRRVQGGDEAEELTVQKIRFNNREASVINANSYPAANLEITYKVFIEPIELEGQQSGGLATLPKSKLRNHLQATITQDLQTLMSDPNSSQIIVYIQDKRWLAELIDDIKTNHLKLGLGAFEAERQYIEIHADLSEEKKRQLELYKDNVKLVFMTASASRGLSFPNVRHILVVVPGFEIENNLMEIIQVIYRGRGGKLDEQDKELSFYLADKAIYPSNNTNDTNSFAPPTPPSALLLPNQSALATLGKAQQERQLAFQDTALNVINILLILKTSIMTRIYGYGYLGRNRFMMIPIGGKSVNAAGELFSSRMSNLLKELRKKQIERRNDKGLKRVISCLTELLSRSEIRIGELTKNNDMGKDNNNTSGNGNEGITRKKSYLSAMQNYWLEDNFQKAANNNLEQLLTTLGPLELGHINGNLLIVPIGEKDMQESYQIRFWQQIRELLDDDIVLTMGGIAFNRHDYSESLRSKMRQLLELVKELKQDQVNRSQRFEQYTAHRSDQYYAMPLFNFSNGRSLQAYFNDNTDSGGTEKQRRRRQVEDADSISYKDTLVGYVQALYPSEGILPIGDDYGEFPFVVFKSYSLAEMRRKIFTERQLLTSNELNVLNMVLSKENVS
jgi:hypothetical protein